MDLLIAYNFAMEEEPVGAPNFYEACAQYVFSTFSIKTVFIPNPEESRFCRILQCLGLGRNATFIVFSLGWVLRNRARFDVIVGWQAMAVLIGALRRLLRWRRPKVCAISYRLQDPSKSGCVPRAKSHLVRYGLQGCEMLLALDRQQAVLFQRELGRQEGRTRALRYGVHGNWYDQLIQGSDLQVRGSSKIFCPGSAYRDESTFIKAVEALDVEIRRYKLEGGREMRAERRRVGRARLVTVSNAPYLQYITDCLASAIVVIPVMNADKPAGLTSLLECMALGRAVIITKGMSSRDYVEDKVTGLLYGQGDWHQLREQITFLLDNPEYARRLGKAARERTRLEYGLEQCGSAFAEILVRLAAVGCA